MPCRSILENIKSEHFTNDPTATFGKLIDIGMNVWNCLFDTVIIDYLT